MTWSRGRQLVEYGDVSYRYDANRIRVAKETDSYRYEYITNGEHNVTAEYHYDKTRQEYVRMINYVYNGGTAESMVLSTLTDNGYDTSRYYLVHDVHGNVSRLLNPDCTLYATYHYDSWGKCTVKNAKREIITDVTDVANLNAIRYRGYYYDVETGLYYLQTRYYDPDTGRFVSPDTYQYLAPEKSGGLNLYAYCLNDPINYFDPTGHFLLSVLLVAGLVFGVVLFAGEGHKQKADGPDESKIGREYYKNIEIIGDNWDEISKDIQVTKSVDPTKEGYWKFDFSKNPYYDYSTSYLYARYLKENCYANDPTRTVEGLNEELIFHFYLYLNGNSHGLDGADMGPARFDADIDAFFMETIAMLNNWPHYYD